MCSVLDTAGAHIPYPFPLLLPLRHRLAARPLKGGLPAFRNGFRTTRLRRPAGARPPCAEGRRELHVDGTVPDLHVHHALESGRGIPPALRET